MKKIAIIAIIVAAVAGGAFYMSRGEGKTTSVRTEKIAMGSLNSKVILEGVVTPKNQVSTFAEYPVRVNRVVVTLGSEIAAGTPILEISADSKAEMEKSRDELNLSINTAEASIANFDRELNNLNFENTTLAQTLNVNRTLLKQDAISSVEVQRSEALFNASNSKMQDIRARREIENQKLNLLISKRGELNNKISSIGNTINATTSGIISEIIPKDGDLVQKGGKLFTTSEAGNYEITVEAPLQLVNIIKVGDSAKVKELPNTSGKEFTGTIKSVANVATLDKKGQKVIAVVVDLPDAAGLNIGFSTSVEIEGTNTTEAKLIDTFSVISEGDKDYVYVVNSGVVEKIPVEIGIRTATKYEVINLPEGTEIIVNPFKVTPGQKVKVGE